MFFLYLRRSLMFTLWYQVSGGFATVHPNNKLTINAVEAAPLEAFSAEVQPSDIIHWMSLTRFYYPRLFAPTSRRRCGLLQGMARRRTRLRHGLRRMCMRHSSTRWPSNVVFPIFRVA